MRPPPLARAGTAAPARRGLVAVLAGALAIIPANAAPPGAVSCSGCHAPAAIASPIPSLEPLSSDEIVSAMRAFKAGTREATVMDRIAKGFSDDEIHAIAQWLATGAERAARATKP